MAHGPGQYDDEVTRLRRDTGAHTVVLLILGGAKGEGFSVQSVEPDVARRLPTWLRKIADEIQKDLG